jgi:hypothetical protein
MSKPARKKPQLTRQQRRHWEQDENRRWSGAGPNPMRKPKGYRSTREDDPAKRRPLAEWLEDH